jgi:FK506-binding protein 1
MHSKKTTLVHELFVFYLYNNSYIINRSNQIKLYIVMGVEKETISVGDGETFPTAGDMLTMHYTGTLAADNQQFDSSVSRGQPFQFVIGIGQVIRGWDEGVALMSLGEKAMLHITSDFGYGAEGAPGAIPPNADLKFEVELLAIGDKKAPGFTGSSSSSWCTLL